MHSTKHFRTFMTLLATPAWLVAASADFTGHWEGAVRTPNDPFPFALDLVSDAKDVIIGSIKAPDTFAQLPLKVEVNKRSIQFHTRTDQTFDGVLSDDGRSITGNYYISGYALPYAVERTGAAVIEPALPSPAIPKELEGIWEGSLDLKGTNGTKMRFLLSMRNEGSGSFGNLVSLDEGELTIPVGIQAEGTLVKLTMSAVNETFEGSRDALGQLAGTIRQGEQAAPITFRRKE